MKWFPLWLVLLLAVPSSAYAVEQPVDGIEIPENMSAGYMVFDRQHGVVTAAMNENEQFRSASLVKLLIALDYLNTQGSLDAVPDEDVADLQSMLRSSDDIAARSFWQRAGRTAVIDRMVDELDLQHTTPPADDDYWGYTAVSAADVVRIYLYLLDSDEKGFGEFILENLDRSTQCATDGRDQYFGIPQAVNSSFTVKQGWSGFPETPESERCTEPVGFQQFDFYQRTGLGDEASTALTESTAYLDLSSPLLHTSGLVDDADTILVVLTLHSASTSWDDAADRVTDLTRDVYATAPEPAHCLFGCID